VEGLVKNTCVLGGGLDGVIVAAFFGLFAGCHLGLGVLLGISGYLVVVGFGCDSVFVAHDCTKERVECHFCW
jgi:hypothetical protein